MNLGSSFVDQIGNCITVSYPPKKIISLVPSQTELLFDLGLKDEIVGITKFCIHPAEQYTIKQKVGGTKSLNVKKIYALKPDLIIANKEENDEKQIKELMTHYPVWVSDIRTLSHALNMITEIGALVNKISEATIIAERIKNTFDSFIQNNFNKTVLYLIWQNPYMSVSGDTFIGCMLNTIGLTNVCQKANSRYPEISVDEINNIKPDFIFLSSEPFPFKEKHLQELQTKIPYSKILIVDGEPFSWYGSRLLKSPNYFNELLKTLALN